MDFWLLAERCVESSSPDARAEAPIAKRDGPAVEDGEVAIERPVVDNVPRRMQEQADVLCPLDGCWQRVRCVVSIMRPKMCVLRLGADDGREADKVQSKPGKKTNPGQGLLVQNMRKLRSKIAVLYSVKRPSFAESQREQATLALV